MKKNIFISSVLAAFFIITSMQAASAATITDFQYQRTIQPVGNGPQWLLIDESMYSHSTLSDVRIFSNNTEQPFRIVNRPYQLLSNTAKIIRVSSERQPWRDANYAASNMLDGNTSTYYEPDVTKDNGVSSFTLDLGEQTLIRSVALNGQFSQSFIQLEVSADNKTFNATVKKTLFTGGQINAPQVTGQFLRFTFWYETTMAVNELKLYGDTQASIMFYAEPDRTYVLEYGNPRIGPQEPAPDISKLVSTATTPVAKLGPEQLNPLFPPDIDGDGVKNAQDNCPYISNLDQKDSDNDRIGDVCDNAPTVSNIGQQDSDKDGVGDATDNCPFIKNPDQKDSDLNGIGDMCDDADHDGIVNSQDNCQNIANYDQEDLNNNGIGDACETDYDKDGVPQSVDNCRNVANADQKDSDHDNIGDACDNCANKYNPDQLDVNENKIGDACEADVLDNDSDGIVNSKDNCPNLTNPDQTDKDGDGVGDACDNCSDLKNASQLDSNNDGTGDICSDDDSDGIPTYRDNCPTIPNPGQSDANNDGVGDACEDTDHDGVLNAWDNCKFVANADQNDKDKDGVGDACDKTDSRWTEQNPWILGGIIIVTIGILGFLGYRLVGKVSKPTVEIKDLEKKK